MSLIAVDLPSPASLRGGWAAMSAVCTSRGWKDSAYATANDWLFHDGGGNWARLRFLGERRAVLVGNDHEYTETYFGPAAAYFEEEETDLLAGAPEWWGTNLDASPFGEWIGFVYGWDGEKWQRAPYDKPDGFDQVGLLRCCSGKDNGELAEHCKDAPGLHGQLPSAESLTALVEADANLNRELLESVVPGWDVDAGVAAAKKISRRQTLAEGKESCGCDFCSRRQRQPSRSPQRFSVWIDRVPQVDEK